MQDLKHHQIATQEKSAVHYFMHLVLENFDIAHEEVNITFDRAENLVDRLVAGEIDAFAMREPYVSMAREKLQDKTTILAAPGIYVQSELLISRQAQLQNNPEVTQRLLRALIKAEEFALQERSEAIALTAKALNTPEAEIEKIWSSLNLEVSLHQTLLPQLERVGYEILKNIEFPWPVADVAHQHHERLDGSGYPQGLKGDEIIEEAQIIAVADVTEAIMNDRPYRKGMGEKKALEIINSLAGTQLNAQASEICINLFNKKLFSF